MSQLPATGVWANTEHLLLQRNTIDNNRLTVHITSGTEACSSPATEDATSPAPPLEIPRTQSIPANPKLLSLLTTLPPEVRNQIYELLFVLRDAVEVAPDHADDLDAFNKNVPSSSEVPISADESRAFEVRATRKSVRQTMKLLSTCRQIYHEAVGYLYSQNHFTIFPQRGLAWTFDTWAGRIRSHIPYLRKVVIGLDAIERSVPKWWDRKFDIYYHSYEVLPILKAIWSASGPPLDITVTCGGNSPRRSYQHSPNIHTEALNSVLRMVGHKDSLAISRYAKYAQGLEAVTVKGGNMAKQCRGEITYGKIYRGPDFSNKFTMKMDGSELAWTVPPRTFMKLPYHIYKRTLAYALYSADAVHVDLTTPDIPALSIGLLFVSHQVRSSSLKSLLVNNQFVFRFASSQSRAPSFNLTSINDWPIGLSTDYSKAEEKQDEATEASKWRTWTRVKHMDFIFDFQLHDNTTTLEDVRMAVVDLVCRTMDKVDSKTVCCRITDVAQDSPHVIHDATFTLETLRLNVFLVLSRLLEAKPWRTNQTCPAIFINGYGNVVETKIPGRKRPQKVPSFGNLASQQFNAREEGAKYAKIFGSSTLHSSHQTAKKASKTRTSLIGVWEQLRDLYWPDAVEA